MAERINRNRPSTPPASPTSSKQDVRENKEDSAAKMLNTKKHVEQLSKTFGAGRIPSIEKEAPRPDQAKSAEDLFRRNVG